MYGLTEKETQSIVDILSTFPQIEKALIFGSRAMGNYKEASDVDIAIIGSKIDFGCQLKISEKLEDAKIPYFFDIVIYHSIVSDALKKHIDEHGLLIYQG